MSPLPIHTKVWADANLDFIEGLLISKGWDAILVIVDRLSKYAHFIPLRHPFLTRTLPEVYIREVVELHGFLETMVSDRYRVFLS